LLIFRKSKRRRSTTTGENVQELTMVANPLEALEGGGHQSKFDQKKKAAKKVKEQW
jgi:hypothetical protein